MNPDRVGDQFSYYRMKLVTNSKIFKDIHPSIHLLLDWRHVPGAGPLPPLEEPQGAPRPSSVSRVFSSREDDGKLDIYLFLVFVCPVKFQKQNTSWFKIHFNPLQNVS